MSGETTITIIGNLIDTPELRFTAAGIAVANFRIASTPRAFDKQANEWKDGESLFLGCSAWRQLAENIAESDLGKGTKVIVSGRLKQRSFETNSGEKRTVYEVDVEDMGPSLARNVAKVNRVERTKPTTQTNARDPWAGEVDDAQPPF